MAWRSHPDKAVHKYTTFVTDLSNVRNCVPAFMSLNSLPGKNTQEIFEITVDYSRLVVV